MKRGFFFAVFGALYGTLSSRSPNLRTTSAWAKAEGEQGPDLAFHEEFEQAGENN